DRPEKPFGARNHARGRPHHGRLPQDASAEREGRGHHEGPRQDGRGVHLRARRQARVQGLPGLPRLHLRLAERHDRPRHPRPLRAEGGGHNLPRRGGPLRGFRDGFGDDGGRGGGPGGDEGAPRHHAPVPRGCDGGDARRQEARGRGACHTGPRGAEGVRGDPGSRLPRGGTQDARGPADPELRHTRHGATPPARDDVRDRAHDHARRLRHPHKRVGRLVDIHDGRLARGPLRAHHSRDRGGPLGPHRGV
ncbi:MAG: Methionine aminopeptidase, partial [uncultured Rubrobacteraceae bacterium]